MNQSKSTYIYRKVDETIFSIPLFSYTAWTTVHSVICLFLQTGYKDLQTRKETREAAWSRPGWDECVAYTGG